MYDRGQGCIVAVDFQNRTVHHGPKWKNSESPPVDIGPMEWSSVCNVYCPISYPRQYQENSDLSGTLVESHFVPVILESGRVDLLDPNTLEIVRSAGTLPCPETLFGFGSCKPRDLLAYDVRPVDVLATKEELAKGEPAQRYVGMIAATVSRQGTSMALAVFDKDAKDVKTDYSKAFPYDEVASKWRYTVPHDPSARAVLSEVPWNPTATGLKYLFESLHPPALTLASFFTAYTFDAQATHRALFLMPNSFVALQRDGQTSLLLNTLCALLVMVPAMLLSGLLAWRITKDAAVIGLSSRERWLWRAGTVLFGLPAYVTYRLMRPKCVLAICRECGRGRRVDQDVCHHCGSAWDWPELGPPAWRVIGSFEEGQAAGTQAE